MSFPSTRFYLCKISAEAHPLSPESLKCIDHADINGKINLIPIDIPAAEAICPAGAGREELYRLIDNRCDLIIIDEEACYPYTAIKLKDPIQKSFETAVDGLTCYETQGVHVHESDGGIIRVEFYNDYIGPEDMPDLLRFYQLPG